MYLFDPHIHRAALLLMVAITETPDGYVRITREVDVTGVFDPIGGPVVEQRVPARGADFDDRR